MKFFFFSILFLFIAVGVAQTPIDKISGTLKSQLELSSENELLVWIYFTDKGDNLERYFTNPSEVVSEKSLARRSKQLGKKSSLDFTDLPVNTNYIDELQRLGFELKQKSKWLNAVSGFASKSEINQISASAFVSKIDAVKKFNRVQDDLQFEQESKEINKINLQPEGIHTLNYGQSFTQLNVSNVPAVHDLGYNGDGIYICVMDAGFHNLTHEVFQSINIVAAWDFVNNDPNVGNQADSGSGTHGTSVLSILGGFKEGQLIGPAYAAEFLLAKTENTDSETPIEEDNWVAAVEWADSIGVDITSTSLGYLDYDPPYPSYTWQNMDGNTAIITIAGDIAASKGILIVTSAGNNGFDPTRNTLGAPADGDSILAIGSVRSNGEKSSFSSVGPTADGRIKPDFMAQGSTVYNAGSGNLYSSGGGTSFSCPIASGISALLLQADPTLEPMEVREIFRNTSSRSLNPDREFGWGIIDALGALNSIITPVDDDNIPESFDILTSYPNPFNPSTKIRFSVSEKSKVQLTLHDILGNEIATIFNNVVAPGIQEISFDGSNLASGIYLVRMITPSNLKTIKISLIK